MRFSLVRRKILRLYFRCSAICNHLSLNKTTMRQPVETQNLASPDYPIANLYAL